MLFLSCSRQESCIHLISPERI